MALCRPPHLIKENCSPIRLCWADATASDAAGCCQENLPSAPAFLRACIPSFWVLQGTVPLFRPDTWMPSQQQRVHLLDECEAQPGLLILLQAAQELYQVSAAWLSLKAREDLPHC